MSFIKGDNTKHIVSKFSFNQQQQEHQKIEVKHIWFEDNCVDLFTKSLPKSTFQKHVQDVGLRKLFELRNL